MKKIFLKAYIIINIFLIFISLFLSIYFFWDKITVKIYDNLFYSFIFFIIFLTFLFIFLGKLNFFYIIGLSFLFIGGFFSWKEHMSKIAFIYYFLFGVLLAVGYIYNNYIKKDIKNMNIYNNYNFSIWIHFLLFLFISCFLFLFSIFSWDFLFYYFNGNDIFRWYFAPRHYNIPLNDIGGSTFNQYKSLILILMFFLLIIILTYLVLKDKIYKIIHLFIILILITFLTKLVISTLSTFGFKILELKTASKYNGTYYFFAVQHLNNFINFIKEYTTVHQVFHDNAHLKCHPWGTVFFYWLICKFISAKAIINALIYGFITSTTSIAIFIITKLIVNNNKVAFIAGLFYALTPNSAILSIAGIDGLIATSTAWMFAFYMLALKQKNYLYSFISGLFMGFGSNLTFGQWYLLLPLFLLFFLQKQYYIKFNIKQFIFDFIKMTFFFILGIAVIFLLLQIISAGNLNYLKSFKIANAQMKVIIENRPYEIWSWINIIHWSQYLSAIIVTLFIIRYIYAMTGEIKMEPYSLISLIAIFIQFFSVIGKAEVHRIWMFLIIFIIPPAILPLLNKMKEDFKINQKMVYFILFLIYLNTVLIEIFITDGH